MSVKSYSPKNAILTVNGQIVKSWKTVKIEFEDDSWEFDTATSDGETTRTRIENNLGKFTITLPQTSSDNDIINDLEMAAAKSDTIPSFVEVQLKDNWGQSLHTMAEGTVSKRASGDYEKSATEREWIITGELDSDIKGNN